MTYLENSKQYTGSDLENIFFRPMLTGESAQDLGVRVLYNMPQPTHVQLWDGQRNILQKFTSAGWAGGKAATKYEKTVNLNRVKAELGFSAANYFSMVYEKVSSVDNEAEAERIVRLAEQKFAGNPGQVMFVIRDGGEDDNSRFIPIAAQNEGDWQALHEQAVGDIVVAHSWFRTLSGLDYAAGFSAERILHEYEVALNTVILAEQDELTEPIRAVIASVLGLDTTSLQIVNRPPTRSKPIYMKVWEARKADGHDLDPERQQAFLSEITKYIIRSRIKCIASIPGRALPRKRHADGFALLTSLFGHGIKRSLLARRRLTSCRNRDDVVCTFFPQKVQKLPGCLAHFVPPNVRNGRLFAGYKPALLLATFSRLYFHGSGIGRIFRAAKGGAGVRRLFYGCFAERDCSIRVAPEVFTLLPSGIT